MVEEGGRLILKNSNIISFFECQCLQHNYLCRKELAEKAADILLSDSQHETFLQVSNKYIFSIKPGLKNTSVTDFNLLNIFTRKPQICINMSQIKLQSQKNKDAAKAVAMSIILGILADVENSFEQGETFIAPFEYDVIKKAIVFMSNSLVDSYVRMEKATDNMLFDFSNERNISVFFPEQNTFCKMRISDNVLSIQLAICNDGNAQNDADFFDEVRVSLDNVSDAEELSFCIYSALMSSATRPMIENWLACRKNKFVSSSNDEDNNPDGQK